MFEDAYLWGSMKTKTKTALVKTWGQIKQQIEQAGVEDDDPVFMIDLGPNLDRLWVAKDKNGNVEVADEPVLLLGNCSE